MRIDFKHWLEAEEAVDFKAYDLQKKYDHYNQLLFGGELPQIPIKWAALKGVGGEVRIKVKGVPPNPRMVRAGLLDRYHGMEVVPGSHIMLISNLFKKSERGLDATLLHEMIHVYFNHIGKISEQHGVAFLRKAKELSEKVGFHIPLTDNIEKLGLSDDVKLKEVGVQIIYRKDNTMSLAMFTGNGLVTFLPALLERWRGLITPEMNWNYGKQTDFYTVATKKWNELGSRYPLQRKKMAMDVAYYQFKDMEALEDLKANGKLLASVPDRTIGGPL
jgi:hypothetical protein